MKRTYYDKLHESWENIFLNREELKPELEIDIDGFSIVLEGNQRVTFGEIEKFLSENGFNSDGVVGDFGENTIDIKVQVMGNYDIIEREVEEATKFIEETSEWIKSNDIIEEDNIVVEDLDLQELMKEGKEETDQ